MLIFGVQKLEMVSHLIFALIQLPCPAKGTFVRRVGSAVEMKNALIPLYSGNKNLSFGVTHFSCRKGKKKKIELNFP